MTNMLPKWVYQADLEDDLEECEFRGESFYMDNSVEVIEAKAKMDKEKHSRKEWERKWQKQELKCQAEAQKLEQQASQTKLLELRKTCLRKAPIVPIVEDWEEYINESEPDSGLCAICLSGFISLDHNLNSTMSKLVTQCCGNSFHECCLAGLPSENGVSVCPLCRAELRKIIDHV
mmetsp:Transcript_45063/g.89484  ORF Transcript_45063/g.89484 Transcript_45063/m.89484 type:complete len:176 (+) Transcript_45063:69-596(+)